MPRPRKRRCIGSMPPENRFKPCGARWRDLVSVVLSIDGYEALRLADHDGLDHDSASTRMGISQPTFSRLLAEARHAVAKALVGGHALLIEGGNFHLTEQGETAAHEGGGRGRRRHALHEEQGT